VTTLTEPVVPAPTVALIRVASTTVNAVAGVPPKETALAPIKLVPTIDITCPVLADAGLKLVIVGIDANTETEVVTAGAEQPPTLTVS
jgi:hypothetical protein